MISKARGVREKAGFSLIEMMIAMVIMSVGLFAIVQMEVVSLRGSGYARERMEAMQIARGVAEELRTKGIEWIYSSNIGSPIDGKIGLGVILPNIESHTIDEPAGCAQLGVDDLHAKQSYGVNEIASGSDFTNARLINMDGLGPDVPQVVDAGSLETARAIYRVHYVANWVNLLGPSANPALAAVSNDIVHVMVFVSWDNKDHGRQDYSWQSTAKVDFWRAHIIMMPVELMRDYHWS